MPNDFADEIRRDECVRCNGPLIFRRDCHRCGAPLCDHTCEEWHLEKDCPEGIDAPLAERQMREDGK